ncbi:hypothetical protein ACMAZF_18935 [Psychrobium sp. nBUS_13]|uniref:hypothetical protein n=1 Tax=Psychrobium sp. nBUS_13 TaxID=3395319 RepID=UPI003EB7A8A5
MIKSIVILVLCIIVVSPYLKASEIIPPIEEYCKKNKNYFKNKNLNNFFDTFVNCLKQKSLSEKEQNAQLKMLYSAISLKRNNRSVNKIYNQTKSFILSQSRSNVRDFFASQIAKKTEFILNQRNISSQSLSSGHSRKGLVIVRDSEENEYIDSILVEYAIQGEKHPIIFDTGASTSLLRQQITSYIPLSSETKAMSATRSQHKLSLGYIKKFSIFNNEIPYIIALFNESEKGADILGLDLLMQFNNICLKDTGVYVNHETCNIDINQWIPMNLIAPLGLTIDIEINEHDRTLLLDTASSHNLLVKNNGILIDNIQESFTKSLEFNTAFGVSTLKVSEREYLTSIDNKSYELDYYLISEDEIHLSCETDGYLGIKFFEKFDSITFDFSNMKLGLGKLKSSILSKQ